MNITAVATKHFGTRPAGVAVDTVVLHADASSHSSATVSHIRDPLSKVSYHALVDRDGSVYRFVETLHRAWACGVSEFRGRANVNDFSVSLAFSNKNDGVETYTDTQYQVGAALVAGWMAKHKAITIDRITTHAAIAPGRKTDPLGFDVLRFQALVKAEMERPGR